MKDAVNKGISAAGQNISVARLNNIIKVELYNQADFYLRKGGKVYVRRYT